MATKKKVSKKATKKTKVVKNPAPPPANRAELRAAAIKEASK